MRERVFAVLGDRVREARVLDLFAGTGAVGIEALSRGAASAVFVERHRAAARLIRANLADLQVDADRARVIERPALGAVEALARDRAVFDLLWADPPFEVWSDGLAALEAAIALGVAAPDADLCLECPAKIDLGRVHDRFEVERDLAGGASRVVILRQRSG
jgi:16S rRNA (guanine(966)-N(2))-methyltransferase RsmD